MSIFGSAFLIFFCLISDSDVSALKCRTGEEAQQNEDFEYVVRMCLRQMKNASRHENFDRNFQSMFDGNGNRKEHNWMQNNRNNRNQGDGDGFEYFWNPNSGRDKDRDQKNDNDRGKMDSDYMEDSDYFHVNPMRGMNDGGRRIRPRPHTYQQQIQHDRDKMYGYGHRDNPYSHQGQDRNKNSKRTPSRDKKGESPLEQLDPCMIHCIFLEMQMLDENGKPDKHTVSEKMSQKIRNPELKSFIQDSVEECFEMIDEEANGSRARGPDFVCEWSKSFAICLEEKGKESCDDWNEPFHRNSNNKNQNDQKNKKQNGKNSNNNGNNNNSNNNNNNRG